MELYIPTLDGGAGTGCRCTLDIGGRLGCLSVGVCLRGGPRDVDCGRLSVVLCLMEFRGLEGGRLAESEGSMGRSALFKIGSILCGARK